MESANLNNAFPELEKLYDSIPGMPCIACGLCCVSPHMTLVEFAYLFGEMLKAVPEADLVKLVSEPMTPEGRFPGNYQCVCQSEKGLCELHTHRPLICRIEGFPVLDRMGIRDQQICPYINEEDMEATVRAEDIDNWIQQAFAISKPFHPVYTEPYWLTGLTLECWLAVALDPNITQQEILNLRTYLREELDIVFLESHYQDTTGLAEQLHLIDSFFSEAENQRPARALKSIRRVVDDFPGTVSYYREEGRRYLALMKKIVKESKRNRR